MLGIQEPPSTGKHAASPSHLGAIADCTPGQCGSSIHSIGKTHERQTTVSLQTGSKTDIAFLCSQDVRQQKQVNTWTSSKANLESAPAGGYSRKVSLSTACTYGKSLRLSYPSEPWQPNTCLSVTCVVRIAEIANCRMMVSEKTPILGKQNATDVSWHASMTSVTGMVGLTCKQRHLYRLARLQLGAGVCL